MNVVVLSGRLTDAPRVRYTADNKAIANFTLAVDYSKDETAFISCVAFERNAEFAEKYLHKGSRAEVSGRIRTGSYTAREGHKVFFSEIVVNSLGFGESKAEADSRRQQPESAAPATDSDGFMSIPDSMDDLPFT